MNDLETSVKIQCIPSVQTINPKLMIKSQKSPNLQISKNVSGLSILYVKSPLRWLSVIVLLEMQEHSLNISWPFYVCIIHIFD